jgi:hypothetical protein
MLDRHLRQAGSQVGLLKEAQVWSQLGDSREIQNKNRRKQIEVKKSELRERAGRRKRRVKISKVRNGTYPECSTGAACCLTNCLNDLTSSIIRCLIPFVESSCSNPKSNGTSHNGSSAGSCQTDRLLLASSIRPSVRMRV